jgi:predicted ATPase
VFRRFLAFVALYPIISQMERAARITDGDGGQVKLDKLDAVLALASTSKQDAALFADLLSLPNDGRYPTQELPPPQRRQQTLAALAAQSEALARQNPVLMIFEDAHWADPTSLELLGRAVDRTANHGVLLIVTHRPEFSPPWIDRSHVTAVTLNRLARRDIDAMIDGVVGNEKLPANIRQEIVERTDGIPLFIEEMTKALLEAGSDDAARQAAAIPCASMAPRTASTTLRNSIRMPSPVRLTTRPLWMAMVGSMRSLRSARSRARVRSSSAPASRL